MISRNRPVDGKILQNPLMRHVYFHISSCCLKRVKGIESRVYKETTARENEYP